MSKYDISIFMPTIRTHLLEGVWDSLRISCHRHTWELVLCGPFDIPAALLEKQNVKFIKDYGHPTRAAQLAALDCEGEMIYHTVDDCLWAEGAISRAIDKFANCWPSVYQLSMLYTEGQGYKGEEIPLESWTVGANPEYNKWANLKPEWIINCHFLMYRDVFRSCGGFDCCFEYLNHACHDLQFRIQSIGADILHSDEIISFADWQPGVTGDHRPINDCQLQHDHPLLVRMWQEKRPVSIDKDNWMFYPDHWERRFGQSKPESYEDLNYGS